MYKLKITGSKKAKILQWYYGPEVETIESMITEVLKKIRTNHKMKLASCLLLKMDGSFVKSYKHLIKAL